MFFLLAAVAAAVAPAAAHPLGNDSVTHFSILHVGHRFLEVDLVLDLAESASAVALRDEIDADGDGQDTPAELQAWLDRQAAAMAGRLHVRLDGSPMPPTPIEPDGDGDPDARLPRLIVKTPGLAGMPTYRLAIRYRAAWPGLLGTATHRLSYRDATFPRRAGLMRILLERPGLIARIPIEPATPADLDRGVVPPALRRRLERRQNPLSEAARLIPRRPGRSWDLDDPPRALALEAIAQDLCVFGRPRIILHEPRPPFRDECEVNPFVYEQYDPADLPAEREAGFTFHIEDPTHGPSPTGPEASGPALGADAPDYRAILTDPRNDPSRRSPARRDAERLLALLQRPWGLTVFLSVTALCFGWGAAHALMPGHAKTLVAACLISRHGSWGHAVGLAFVVTLTHTALVVVVGAILWMYQRTHPDLGPALQLWLGTVAGLLVTGMGLALLRRGWSRRPAHHHHLHHDHHAAHLPDTSHHHHPPVGDRPHDPDAHRPEPVTLRLLLLLGVTGGMVPCPTAAIIMLLGIGANVLPGALYAVGVFSMGLALTLMGVGFAALGSRRFAARLMSDAEAGGHLSPAGDRLLNRWLPAASGLAVLVLGVALAAHYLHALRTGLPLWWFLP